jgi:hypothetical protein
VRTPLPDPATAQWASFVNLLLPGGGLILIGATGSGIIVGIVFAVAINLALIATFLVPDDFSRNTHALVVGVAGGCYLGAQLRYAQALRNSQRAAQAALRRETLQRAQALLAEQQTEDALKLLYALSEICPGDLLVTYRLAQVLTSAGHKRAARVAWRRLATLDRHGIYRVKIAEYERQAAQG